ncbi:outer membrane protein [Terrarubrum flagellatum]|uniref:outer membrane protein n=1 Tax=Terrirubrum flagellatum TaxID=2895980 RepID=UPI00314549F5
MRFAPALALSILATAPALAADFPVLRGSYAPPVAARPSGEDQLQWEGFYIGGFAGYSAAKFGDTATSANSLMSNFYSGVSRVTVPDGFRQSSTFTYKLGSDQVAQYGGFVGYNMVFGDAVVGVEADASSLNVSRTAQQTITAVDINGVGVGYSSLTGTTRAKLDSYATFRARAGWAVGNFMPFVTAGLAVGKGSYTNTLSLTFNTTAPGPSAADAPILTSTFSKRNLYVVGGTFGAGIDYLVLPNVLVRGEYQFVRFDDTNIPLDINTVRAAVAVKF